MNDSHETLEQRRGAPDSARQAAPASAQQAGEASAPEPGETSAAPRLLLPLLIATALVLRLDWAWSELETLLRYAISDDAFYYFQIARNWAGGNGASLDGTTATNGFHPLWLALLVGVQALTSDAVLALRLGLSLGALLGAASVALLYRVVARSTGSTWAALFGAALYAVHPTTVTESVNGLETELAIFTTAWVTDRYYSLCSAAPARTQRAAILLGLAGGALLLTRSDAVFLWAALLAGLVITSAGVRWALVAGLVSSACVLPWLAWSQVSFGSVMQVSAVAIPELLRADFLAAHGDDLAMRLTRSGFLVRRAFGADLPHLYAVPPGLPAWPVAVAGLAAVFAALRNPVARTALVRMLPLFVGVSFTLLWHAGVRWWTREWYFAPAGWVGAAGLAVCFSALLAQARALSPTRRTAALASLATLASLTILGLAAPPLAARWRVASEHRVQQLEAARWLATRTPPDARIGAFNAGIYSYFSGRTVVNLDGAVNADAYAARRENRLLDYAVAARLDHLVDWRGTLPMLGCAQRNDVRCERIAVIGKPLAGFAGSPIWVMRLDASSAPAGR